VTTLKNFTDGLSRLARIALEASEDMDNAYTFVKQGASNTDTCDLCDTAGERPVGVIDRNYDDGEICSIIYSGIATVRAGAAVASGAVVATDASGRAITATYAHEWQAGRALTAASAAGDEIVIMVDVKPIDTASLLGYGFKVFKARVAAASAGFAAETTLFTLPAGFMVQDCFVNVITAEATGGTKTIDVGTAGTSNDPDGFIDGASVAGIAKVRGQATVTTGVTETYYSANTRGVLLSDYLAGTNAADDFGIYREKPDFTAGGDPVTASPGSADFEELVADVYVIGVEIG
jgi:hypothetical protein